MLKVQIKARENILAMKSGSIFETIEKGKWCHRICYLSEDGSKITIENPETKEKNHGLMHIF